MAGTGAAPKATRRRANEPLRGEIKSVPGIGWQHGKTPASPKGLMPGSVTAWKTWMAAWFAAHWGPEDLPALSQLVKLYDQVERGEFQRSTELRLMMDTYGITPKGQQDRRWRPPSFEKEPVKRLRASSSAMRDRLTVVDGTG